MKPAYWLVFNSLFFGACLVGVAWAWHEANAAGVFITTIGLFVNGIAISARLA